LEFEVKPAEIEETSHSEEDPRRLVVRLGIAKAEAVASRLPDALVIAADTVVVLDGEVLGKPRHSRENQDFLARLSGRSHLVYTGHALIYAGRKEVAVVRTVLTFRRLSGAEIDRYVATGEGADKAGGYAIQGVGAVLVAGIDGCYSNVIGLSVPTLIAAAERLGVFLV